MTDDVLSSAPNLSAPLISVVVTSFNYGRFVRQALESVAGQDYPNWECLVVDDCSRDDSCGLAQAWLQKYAGRFNRVELLRTRQNSGPVVAHNTAWCKLAKGCGWGGTWPSS